MLRIPLILSRVQLNRLHILINQAKRKKALMNSLRIFIIAAMTMSPAAMADGISIVGSSTVYPFSTVAADLFGQDGGKAPIIESTGTGGGLKLFCGGGDKSPDITNASRAIKPSEEKICAKNGVSVLEIKIGYDGIVIARAISAPEVKLTPRDVFLALAKDTPDGETLRPNPHKTWADVNPSLPETPIRVYGPPPTSGTRDAFAELVLEPGCDSYPHLKALKKSDKNRHRGVCHGVREDGAYIESGENDNLIIQKLVSNPESFGVFGFSFLEENIDKVRAAPVNGIAPDFDAIADGSYPVSRPLFFYVNTGRFDKTPGLREFVNFFIAEEVMGEDGELTDRGLIPLPADEYNAVHEAVEAL